MEIGTEISRKIRTAIKGKLQELGAYVDEELPDYIMVMVANKKSQEQMTDDLSLFLGNNTSRFTTWLQGVLEKLRTVTPGSNSIKASEAIIFNSAMPPLKSQSREDSRRETLPQHQEKYPSVAPSSSQAPRSSDRTSTDAILAARLTSAVKPLQESSPSEAVIDIKLDLDDAFSDDLSFATESSLQPRKKPSEVAMPKTHRPAAQIYRPPGSSQSSHRPEERSALHRLPQSRVLPAKASSSHGSRVVGTTKPYKVKESNRADEPYRSGLAFERASRSQEQSDLSRKRKIPVASSVVKVKRLTEELVDDDEEEEEEDEAPASAIPSSVSVPSRPERRPTLPPSKQANKNLILKAISEAQESITRTTRYPTVPPKQMVPVAPRAHLLSEEELILMKSRASMLRYQGQPEEPPVLETPQVDEGRKDILSRLQPEPMEVSPSTQDAQEMDNPHTTDSRSFILKSSQYSKNSPLQTQTPGAASRLQPGRLIQPRENPASEKPASPKFIVTLDGVPSPQSFRFDQDTEEEPMAYEEEGEHHSDPYNEPTRAEPNLSMYLKQQQCVPTTNEPTATAKTKIPERCKYWPACKNAESCAYHHPTTVCKAFPKCRFADKCFFIHPNCKFDAKCTKADCPYTHASRRTPAPPLKPAPAVKTQSGKVQCRYFPSCKNTECPFFHPKHCRFSNQCTRADCEFYHPAAAVPPRHALTWTRAQAGEAEAAAAGM
ncbi:LOW QUALITY PROTEIN: zinc finger CCCH domain-containing protein 14 [Gastrophryne carolinensis]